MGEPAPGLITCTATVPAVEEVPEALRLVEEMKVVGSMVPPKITWAPLRKLLPLTEIVKLPTGMGEGRAAVTTGILVNSVMLEGALVECASAALTAFTVTLVDFVNVAGAV